MKEKVLTVKFDKEPVYHDRHVNFGDNELIVYNKKGKKITLAEHKKLYPYKLDNDVVCFVETTLRSFSFKISKNYYWNGADIPSILWFLVGSKDSPEFKVPSMVHDFILEFKSYIFTEVLCEILTVKEYRRLTSLIFRDLLKTYGTKTVKSNIMAGTVDLFQAIFNRKEWNIENGLPIY